MQNPRLLSVLLGGSLTAALLLMHPAASPSPASAAPVEPVRQESRSIDDRVQELERALPTGVSETQPTLSSRLDRLEQRMAAAEAAARRTRQPADDDAERVRSAVEGLEESVRRIEGRIATIERSQRGGGVRAPADELFDLRRSVDRLAAKVDDLDYRVRRLEFARGR